MKSLHLLQRYEARITKSYSIFIKNDLRGCIKIYWFRYLYIIKNW